MRAVSLLFGCLALPVMLGAGCAGKILAYPEDHERYLRIDRAVESLREAYVKKNISGMASLMVPVEQLERVQNDAQTDFDTYQDIVLNFTPERIMIDGDNIDVDVHWQGLWRKEADDPGLRQRGHMRLEWAGTESILLRGVRGDAPFGMKSRQRAPDPESTPPKK